MGVLLTGDNVRHYKNELWEWVPAHHTLFCQLYADSVKVKPHLLFHVLLKIIDTGVNFNTFAPERKHRQTISYSNFCQQSCNEVDAYVLRRAAVEHLSFLEHNPCACEPIYAKALNSSDGLTQLALMFNCHDLKIASELHTAKGVVHTGNMIVCGTDHHEKQHVGIVRLIVQASHVDGRPSYHIIVSEHRQVTDTLWHDSYNATIVDASLFRCSVPFAELSAGAVPLFPKCFG